MASSPGNTAPGSPPTTDSKEDGRVRTRGASDSTENGSGGTSGPRGAKSVEAPGGEDRGGRDSGGGERAGGGARTTPRKKGRGNRRKTGARRRAGDGRRSSGEGDGRSGRRKKRSRKRQEGARAERNGAFARPDAAARHQFQRLATILPDGVVTLDAELGVSQWSVAASRITGRRRREIERRGVASVFRNEAAFQELIDLLEAKGRVGDHEATLVNASGDDVPVRIYATRLKDPVEPDPRDGVPDRYLLVLHDVTEVQSIRQRLIETEKLSAMAKIAGSVAHEFRNPLNSLFLNTDLLEDELEGRDEVRGAIEPTLSAIREEIERLNQIITHYLSLSKIASSSPESLDLGQVVREFVEEWTPRAAERGVELRARYDEETHGVSADPNQVRRVLVNLVENAFDALTEEQETEGRSKSPTVTLAVRRMRRHVKVTVKDNGPGMPTDLRERAFEPFFTSKSGGSGLGLYLVREIVLAAGGAISLTGGEGRGTSVSVRWPLPAPDEEDRA